MYCKCVSERSARYIVSAVWMKQEEEIRSPYRDMDIWVQNYMKFTDTLRLQQEINSFCVNYCQFCREIVYNLCIIDRRPRGPRFEEASAVRRTRLQTRLFRGLITFARFHPCKSRCDLGQVTSTVANARGATHAN